MTVFSQGYESDISFDGDDEDCQILSPYESESNPSTEDEDPRDVKKVKGNKWLKGNKLRLVPGVDNISGWLLIECWPKVRPIYSASAAANLAEMALRVGNISEFPNCTEDNKM